MTEVLWKDALVRSRVLDCTQVKLLGTMQGGYNVSTLVEALETEALAPTAVAVRIARANTRVTGSEHASDWVRITILVKRRRHRLFDGHV